MAVVQPGRRMLIAIRGTTMVAKNRDNRAALSTVSRRMTRYCKPKAPPATAATRIMKNPKIIGLLSLPPSLDFVRHVRHFKHVDSIYHPPVDLSTTNPGFS